MPDTRTNTHRFLQAHPLLPEAQIAAVSSQQNAALSAMLFVAYVNSTPIVDEVFDALLNRKLDSETATKLALHCDTPQRVDALLAVEKRATVLAQLINSSNTQLSAENLEKLSSGKVAKAVGEALAKYLENNPAVDIDDKLRSRILRSGGYSGAFINLLYRSDMSDTEAFELLTEDPKWASKLRKFDFNLLEDLLTVRPGLLSLFVSHEANFAFAYAASGSHTLTSQELQDAIVHHPGAIASGRMFSWAMSRLAWNPRCTSDTMSNIERAALVSQADGRDFAFEAVQNAQSANRFAKAGFAPLSEISSEEAISFFMKRNTGRFARKSDGELLALLRNPNLSGEQYGDLCLSLIGTAMPVVEEIAAVFETKVVPSTDVQEYEKERIRAFIENERKKDYSPKIWNRNSYSYRPRDYSKADTPLSEVTVAQLLSHATTTTFNPQTEITGLSVEAWNLFFILLDDSSYEQELEPLVLAAAATC